MNTYNIYTLDKEYITTITVHQPGNQAVCNAIVELGINPLLCIWKHRYNSWKRSRRETSGLVCDYCADCRESGCDY